MDSNRKFKWVLGVLLGTFLLCGTAGNAFSTVYAPGGVVDIGAYLNGVNVTPVTGMLQGSYYVTSLDYEADDNISFTASKGATPLFTNKSTASEAGTWKYVSQIKTYTFYDQTRGDLLGINNREQVHVYLLNQNWTTKNGVALTAGSLIIGLNDKGSSDKDYDDFIIAVSKTAPAHTPIPAAAWLLGSGLAGLAGFRRFASRRQSAE